MQNNINKIGIMGGTFDPIHLGHLFIADEIRHRLQLDKIIFIPTGNPPHKKGTYTKAFDRYIMTLLATNNNEYFEVLDIEVNREGNSYSYDTLIELNEIYKDTEFYFITGADAIIELSTWRNIDKVVKLCKFVAATRPGYDVDKLKNEIESLKIKYNAEITILQLLALQISSTDIRKRIKNGESVKYFLNENVKKYIEKKRLYR